MNSRIDLMLGDNKSSLFENKKIAIFGVGGVGGYVLEGLVRSCFKHIDIYDFDKVDETNLNRQIISNKENIGTLKIDAAISHVKQISEDIEINGFNMFVNNDNIDQIDFTKYDYVIDCVDTVEAKMAIIKKCHDQDIKVISSMGTGNKLDPTKLYIADITKTDICPLARVIRKKCRDMGIKHLTVLASHEEPMQTGEVVGSMIFVPASAGLLIASYIVRDILGDNNA